MGWASGRSTPRVTAHVCLRGLPGTSSPAHIPRAPASAETVRAETRPPIDERPRRIRSAAMGTRRMQHRSLKTEPRETQSTRENALGGSAKTARTRIKCDRTERGRPAYTPLRAIPQYCYFSCGQVGGSSRKSSFDDDTRVLEESGASSRHHVARPSTGVVGVRHANSAQSSAAAPHPTLAAKPEFREKRNDHTRARAVLLLLHAVGRHRSERR